jgi:hypothetical protein
MIIPEAKSTDEYELSMRGLGHEELNLRPVFDASFIYSVHINGYNKALEIRSNRPENDDVVIDLLFRELLQEGDHRYGYTYSFIRVFEDGTRVEIPESERSEERMRRPVSDALWLRAEKLISKASDASDNFMWSWTTGTADDPKEMTYNFDNQQGWLDFCEITFSQNKQARLSVVIRESCHESAQLLTRDQYHFGNAMFHYKFDPAFFTDEEPWVMPTWASQLIKPDDRSRSEGEFAFILRDEGGDFIRDDVRAGWNKQTAKWDKLALINGLIRIHNHLNNPGMSDEAYQKSLG